jgi:hypothetical protein
LGVNPSITNADKTSRWQWGDPLTRPHEIYGGGVINNDLVHRSHRIKDVTTWIAKGGVIIGKEGKKNKKEPKRNPTMK